MVSKEAELYMTLAYKSFYGLATDRKFEKLSEQLSHDANRYVMDNKFHVDSFIEKTKEFRYLTTLEKGYCFYFKYDDNIKDDRITALHYHAIKLARYILMKEKIEKEAKKLSETKKQLYDNVFKFTVKNTLNEFSFSWIKHIAEPLYHYTPELEKDKHRFMIIASTYTAIMFAKCFKNHEIENTIKDAFKRHDEIILLSSIKSLMQENPLFEALMVLQMNDFNHQLFDAPLQVPSV